jgi:hypothetical protein
MGNQTSLATRNELPESMRNWKTDIGPGIRGDARRVALLGGTLSAATLTVSAASGEGLDALVIDGGRVVGLPVLAVRDGGRVSLSSTTSDELSVSGLAVASGPGGGLIDLGAGRLAIAPAGAEPSALRAAIIAGRNEGGWDGVTGITSATAASSGGTRAIGYLEDTDGSARVSFAAAGDVDLSGQVNVFDLVSINSAGKYGTGVAAVWSQGDFNYDGVTNVFDLVGINTAAVYGQGNYLPSAPTATGLLGDVAAVPEPTGVVLMASAALAGLAQRRRR